MVVLSTVLHLGALGVAVVRPMPRAMAAAPAVIAVELVADPTRSAAPKLAAVRPPPPAAKPKPAKTVLPVRPSEPKPKPKAEPKPAPERKEVVIEPAPKEEKSLEDLLSDFREEQGEPVLPRRQGVRVGRVARARDRPEQVELPRGIEGQVDRLPVPLAVRRARDRRPARAV